MLVHTQGIVLSTIPYKETSIISKIFTYQFGLLSCLKNGVRSTKGTTMAYYQPLQILDLVLYHHRNAEIVRIREAKILTHYHTWHTNPIKIMACSFVSECMVRMLQREMPNQEFFEYCLDWLKRVDQQNEIGTALQEFLFYTAHFTGFSITNADELTTQIAGSKFYTLLDKPKHETLKQWFYHLSRTSEDRQQIKLSHKSYIFNILLAYLSLHFPDLENLNTLPIVRTLLKEFQH